MKELSKDEIKQIAYNCRKATFLIEKEMVGKITLREKLELKIHLTGCSICRIFQEQSKTINRMVKNIFNNQQREQPGLDENFKKILKEQVKQKLDEK